MEKDLPRSKVGVHTHNLTGRSPFQNYVNGEWFSGVLKRMDTSWVCLPINVHWT